MCLLAWCTLGTAADWQAEVIGDGQINVPLLNFDVHISSAPPRGQYQLLKDPERTREVLSHLYLNRVLAAEARELGLDRDERLQAEIENFIERRLALARLDALRRQPVPDLTQAAREYHKAHYDDFVRPARVRVAHILIRWKGKRSKEEARKLAEEIRTRLLAGEDFAALADRYSEDPSAQHNHGDLGWVSSEQVVPEFAKVVFGLKPGQISPVFESRYGFHVARVEAKKPAEPIPFEEAKAAILRKLERDYREDRVRQYLESLRKRRPIAVEKKVLEPYVQEKLESLRGELGMASPGPAESLAKPLHPQE
ncbi:peptidylprolyl isomerase [Methylomarinovum tepidoasis]|nr:peptidylprolyl isomerase [Methylomarinovum sp. IN45]